MVGVTILPVMREDIKMAQPIQLAIDLILGLVESFGKASWRHFKVPIVQMRHIVAQHLQIIEKKRLLFVGGGQNNSENPLVFVRVLQQEPDSCQLQIVEVR